MTLDETLNHLQANRIPLVYRDDNRVEAWASKKQSMPFRRAIYAHNDALHNLVQSSDCRVCVSPERHRTAWKELGENTCVCVLCLKLDRHIKEMTYGQALSDYYRRKDEEMEALEARAEQDMARLKLSDVLDLHITPEERDKL